MASSLTRTIFSRNKKVALLEHQLSRRKKVSCSMVHYLSDKVEAAESFRKIDREISEEELKDLIFAGLPAEQYADYIREIQGHSLMVIGSKLVKFEKEMISLREEVFEARWSDRKMHRGDIIVIMALVLTLLFGVGANPSDNLFEPFHNQTNCICEGLGARKVCSCTPFLFLIFESTLAAGFTIAVLMVGRMAKDFRLCWWIWASLAFVAVTFLMSIFIATPCMFRRTMMIIDFVTILSICFLMLTIRYWRSIWFFLKLLFQKFVGGVRLVCKKVVAGFKKLVGGLKVAWTMIVGGVKLAWNKMKTVVFGAPPLVPPEPQLPDHNV